MQATIETVYTNVKRTQVTFQSIYLFRYHLIYINAISRKSGNIRLTYLKHFSSNSHQSMKMSDSDLKINQNIYPDTVTYDRMRLIGPEFDQLGPISHCLLEET